MKNIKYIFSVIVSLLSLTGLYGQKPSSGLTLMQQLPVIYLHSDNSVHFLSPQPIKYVDISTHQVHGDLPLENMLRIKFQNDSTGTKPADNELGTLTIVAEDFIAQYRLCYLDLFQENLPSLIEIDPLLCQPLNTSGDILSEMNKKEISINILSKRNYKPIVQKKDFGISVSVNQIYSVGDYMFLDISFSNATKLSYDIDEFRIFIEDKKILKTSNFQSLEITPIWKFKEISSIKSKQRNIYVIKKVIFPNNKVLKISLSEKQISGRMIDVKVDFKDILNAQSI
ncbi:conjugative transposon protein TraN [Sphingobacterium litopenaei]|uniref:Conjugative transposon protein TraN n=1 Tax=Sphingobacterium litopenaei TaxID=2763500 RepID=A0ABR7YFY2_9SPHI|nr:conjugative transposon protein TraN [Sphingobacterium litopenaei]MBD1430208.1 conjugative transposon protein TraN [Sphingobacterium litopenaei]